MILLIDNYDSFTFNLAQLLETAGYRVKVVRNDAIPVEKIGTLAPQAIVISPGPGNPQEAGISLEVIRRYAGVIPILGVCLGHQSIGEAFGGKVIRAKSQMHGKLSRILHRGRGLFRGLPNGLTATRYHSLVVERSSLPRCLEITAETSDGVIMGLKHRKYRIEGAQFHPESIMTEGGEKMIRNFLGRPQVRSAGGSR